jgi:type I restriction enzyme R subunit
MIRDHIITSIHIDKEDLNNTSFSEKCGLVKIWELLVGRIDKLPDEMNTYLVA